MLTLPLTSSSVPVQWQSLCCLNFYEAVRLADELLVYLATPSLSSLTIGKCLECYVIIKICYKSLSSQWLKIGVIHFF